MEVLLLYTSFCGEKASSIVVLLGNISETELPLLWYVLDLFYRYVQFLLLLDA